MDDFVAYVKIHDPPPWENRTGNAIKKPAGYRGWKICWAYPIWDDKIIPHLGSEMAEIVACGFVTAVIVAFKFKVTYYLCGML
jgi:hypothetical protein